MNAVSASVSLRLRSHNTHIFADFFPAITARPMMIRPPHYLTCLAILLIGEANLADAFAPQRRPNVIIKKPAASSTLPIQMVGAGIDPTSPGSTPPEQKSTGGSTGVITNPSTRFGDPVSDEMKEFNKGAVGFLKRAIFDTLFFGRDFPRFYALETIARVPYFSYTAALHFYETIGMWRKAKYLKIHFAEDWNEMHHLMIMESLGGADRWFDRFVAQHISVGYYLLALGLYFWNPTMSYNLNQYIEEHAFLTYDQFLKEKEEELKAQPAPQVALDYYRDGDLYMFDEFQVRYGKEEDRTYGLLFLLLHYSLAQLISF